MALLKCLLMSHLSAVLLTDPCEELNSTLKKNLILDYELGYKLATVQALPIIYQSRKYYLKNYDSKNWAKKFLNKQLPPFCSLEITHLKVGFNERRHKLSINEAAKSRKIKLFFLQNH